MKHNEIIYEKLSEIKLPQLPQVLVQLIDLCRSEEVDIRLIAQTVSQDLTITTKTLQLANSAFLGARSQFKNIDQAVIFLGVDTVRNLAISVSVNEIFTIKKQHNNLQFNNEEFWYHSLLTALLSKTIAYKSGYDDPAAAYLSGLLHDTGKYLLFQIYGEKYQKFMNELKYSPNLIIEEKKEFGGSHCDAGKWLLDNWNIPTNYGIAVRDHHNTDRADTTIGTLGRIIRLANTLTVTSEQFDEQTIKDASILCISPSLLPVIVNEQTEALKNLSQTLGINIKEPEPNKQPHKDETSHQQLNRKIELRAQLYGFMDNIIQAQTINRVFLTLEETLSLLFDCTELVLLLPNQCGENLIVQGSFRNEVAMKLKKQNFNLEAECSYTDETNTQHHLDNLKTSLVISSENTSTQLDPLFNAIKRDCIFVVPVKISKKQQGILVLGMTSSDDPIQKQEETLQLISSHVGNRLYQEILKDEYATAFARERLTAAEEMARSIAHEISNPLAIIQNYISLLTDKNDKNQELNNDLSIINKEIERIANISKQLGDLSRPPKAPNSNYTDVSKVMLETVNLFKNSIPPQANISIDYQPIGDIPSIWIEENSLKQILANLITNSIDALEKGGIIEIHCHTVPETSPTAHGEIVIIVSDNGPGVPPSIVNTIFRAGQTTKPNGHAGLGLTIVNKLVKDISARIYHSTGKQGNTQFTLHLPILKRPKL